MEEDSERLDAIDYDDEAISKMVARNQLRIQKVFSLSGKFSVKDAEENEVYFVEGSFMQIPMSFSIMDVARQEVALITKKNV